MGAPASFWGLGVTGSERHQRTRGFAQVLAVLASRWFSAAHRPRMAELMYDSLTHWGLQGRACVMLPACPSADCSDANRPHGHQTGADPRPPLITNASTGCPALPLRRITNGEVKSDFDLAKPALRRSASDLTLRAFPPAQIAERTRCGRRGASCRASPSSSRAVRTLCPLLNVDPPPPFSSTARAQQPSVPEHHRHPRRPLSAVDRVSFNRSRSGASVSPTHPAASLSTCAARSPHSLYERWSTSLIGHTSTTGSAGFERSRIADRAFGVWCPDRNLIRSCNDAAQVRAWREEVQSRSRATPGLLRSYVRPARVGSSVVITWSRRCRVPRHLPSPAIAGWRHLGDQNVHVLTSPIDRRRARVKRRRPCPLG